jgi:hypothetical protein
MRATMSLIAALLLSLCLAACSADNAQPTVLAPSSPSPTVTSADTPAIREIDAPVLPPEAEAQTADGAMAFVRHYFAVVDYAYATGDTVPLAAVSDPECAPCARIISLVNDATSRKLTYYRDPTTISSVSGLVEEPFEAVEIDMVYSTSGLSKVDQSGVVVATTDPVTDQHLRMLLIKSGTSWLVRNYRSAP